MVGAETLIDKALGLGVVSILEDYLKAFHADEDVVLMVLLAISCLADCGMSAPMLSTISVASTKNSVHALNSVLFDLSEKLSLFIL